MMLNTVKKSKRDGSGKRLSYVVTESGLVENDETLDKHSDHKRMGIGRTTNPRNLIGSITEIGEAKNKFKELGDRRKNSLSQKISEDDKRNMSLVPKQKDPKAALAEINKAEAARRRSSITIADIAETKRRLSIAPRRDSKEDLRRNSAKSEEDDEIQIGLIEADAMKKRMQQIGAALLMTKAIGTMSAPRRQRKTLMKAVFYLNIQ